MFATFGDDATETVRLDNGSVRNVERLLDTVLADWGVVSNGPVARRGLRGWEDRHPGLFTGFAGPGVLVDAYGSMATGLQVEVMLALLAEARLGDGLAERTVLQLMRSPMGWLTNRWMARVGSMWASPVELVADVVTETWRVVRLASTEIGDTARPSWWIRDRVATTLKDSARSFDRRVARERNACAQPTWTGAQGGVVAVDELRSVLVDACDPGYVDSADVDAVWDWTVRDIRVGDDARRQRLHHRRKHTIGQLTLYTADLAAGRLGDSCFGEVA